MSMSTHVLRFAMIVVVASTSPNTAATTDKTEQRQLRGSQINSFGKSIMSNDDSRHGTTDMPSTLTIALFNKEGQDHREVQSYSTPLPTCEKTPLPTCDVERRPTSLPTCETDMLEPSTQPSDEPSEEPTEEPSEQPSEEPSEVPSDEPSEEPSSQPSVAPTSSGSIFGTVFLDLTADNSGRKLQQSLGFYDKLCANVKIQLVVDNMANIINETITNFYGEYSFTGLAAGKYYVYIPTPESGTCLDEGMLLGENPLLIMVDAGENECGNIVIIPTPSALPTTSYNPTRVPTASPSENPTTDPTTSPTLSHVPTISTMPTEYPSEQPSEEPSASPTEEPSEVPTGQPSASPSKQPTETPSVVPTLNPSISISPTDTPTVSSRPTSIPTRGPSYTPTSTPTSTPTFMPTDIPTFMPTGIPTVSFGPSSVPTNIPSIAPSSSPTITPTISKHPSNHPSSTPTISNHPSSTPSKSSHPSSTPSKSSHPSSAPSCPPISSEDEFRSFIDRDDIGKGCECSVEPNDFRFNETIDLTNKTFECTCIRSKECFFTKTTYENSNTSLFDIIHNSTNDNTNVTFDGFVFENVTKDINVDFIGGAVLFMDTSINVTTTESYGSAEITFNNCSFLNNEAASNNIIIPNGFGGVADVQGYGSKIKLSNSKLKSNSAQGIGGCVLATDGATLVVDDSNFTSNEAKLGTGGALVLFSGATTLITGSTFYGNTAKGAGGGIYVSSDAGNVALKGNTFKDNLSRFTPSNDIHFGNANESGFTCMNETNYVCNNDTIRDYYNGSRIEILPYPDNYMGVLKDCFELLNKSSCSTLSVP